MPSSGEILPDTLAHPDPIAAAALVSSDDEFQIKAANPSSLGITLSPSADSKRGARPVAPFASSAPADRGDSRSQHDDDDHGHVRSAWPMALLASYASAMTIACGWLWWASDREAPGRPAAPAWAAGLDAAVEPDAGAEAGRRDDVSAVVEPSEPIAEGRLIPLGDSARIDALEIHPERVTVGPVELKRTRVDGRTERRDGGSHALRLHLRLRNTSDSVIFAPLDEAFVREPDRRLPETFIQDGSGTRIYAYRLPVSSEWEIAGQSFHELRPGEQLETVVLSDTNSRNRLDGPLVWRLRLRTAPETTTVLGVTFDASEVEPAR